MAGIEVEFLETTQQTKGAYLKIQSTIHPTRHKRVPLHYHTTFSEEFTIIKGELKMLVGEEAREMTLLEGNSLLAAPLTPHSFWNDSEEPCTYQVVIRPPFDYENTLRINHGLASDGLGSKKGGIPKSIWHKAMLIKMGDTYYLGIPLIVQKIAFGLLSLIGKTLGKYKVFEKYKV